MADVKLSKLVTKRLPSAIAIPASITPANVSTLFFPMAAGSLTAGVWKEVFSLNAPGVLLGAVVVVGGSTSKRVGIRVTIDGVVAGAVQMGSASNNAGSGVSAGMLFGGGTTPAFGWAPFQTLKVEVWSDINTSEPMYGVHYTGLEV